MANILVDKAASQEMAVAVSEGAIYNAVDQVVRPKNSERAEQKLISQEQELSKLVESDNKGQTAMGILRAFLGKAAHAGIVLGKNLYDQKLEKEMRDTVDGLYSKTDMTEDSVELSSGSKMAKLQQAMQKTNAEKNLQVRGDLSSNKEVQELMLQRAQILSQMILTNDQKLKQRLAKLDAEIAEKSVVVVGDGKESTKEAFALQHGSEYMRAMRRQNSDQVYSQLEEFSSLFSEYLNTNDPKVMAKAQQLEEALEKMGISPERLGSLKASIKQATRQQVANQLKEGLMLQMLSSSDVIQKASHKLAMNQMLAEVVNNQKLGGKDFGHHEGFVDGTYRNATRHAKSEVKGFVLQELENMLVKKTLSQNSDFRDIEKLIELGRQAGFDAVGWIQEKWPQKKDDHGLYLMDLPNQAAGQTVNANSDNPQRQRKHGYEFEKEDEQELLVQRLRAIYMQRALKGNIRTNLETFFKMRRLKNGLLRLGIFTREFDETVQQEARVVAKMKALEMVQEGLLERATLYDLAGPAHDLIGKKIKGQIKNLERLGMPIDTMEFTIMRDKANRRMYEVSKRELDMVEAAFNVNKSPFLAKKQKLLIKLLSRLKEESSIEDTTNWSAHEKA